MVCDGLVVVGIKVLGDVKWRRERGRLKGSEYMMFKGIRKLGEWSGERRG